jgi:hypothetical protein
MTLLKAGRGGRLKLRATAAARAHGAAAVSQTEAPTGAPIASMTSVPEHPCVLDSSACRPPTAGVQLQQLDNSGNPLRGEAVTFNVSVSQPDAAVAATVGDSALEMGRDMSNSQVEISLATALSWKMFANVDRGAVSAANELVVTSNDRDTIESGTRPPRPTIKVCNDSTSSGESDIELSCKRST